MNQRRKKKVQAVAAALCAAAVFFTSSALGRPPVSAASSAVTTAYLNLRDKAGTDGAVLATLPSGETLTVLDDSNQAWVKVRTSSGLEGWCSREYLSLSGSSSGAASSSAPASSGQKATATVYLNLRSGAGTSYPVLATLSRGTSLTVLSTSGEWARVRTSSGVEGYCSLEYLQLESSSSSSASSSGGSSSAGGVTVTVATTNANLKLRTGPGVTYFAIVTMPQGTRLTVLDNSNSGWAQVRMADGRTGWSSKEYLDFSTETAPPSSSSSTASSSSPGTPLEPSPPSSGSSTTAVTTANLKLRTGPGTSYDMILILANGVKVDVTDNSNPGWAKVRTASGKEGWCSKDYLRITTTGGGTSEPEDPPVSSGSASSSTSSGSSSSGSSDHTIVGAVVNADALRLREEKSTSSRILATLPKGTQVSVLDASDSEWIQVKTSSGLTGYMSAQYLTLRYADDPPETLPSGDITLSHSTGTVPQGKTFYLKASGVSTVNWSSSNPAVASVTNGFVEALSPGTAVITASYGNSSASCTVTVTAAEAVRTAYTSPNIASIGESVSLVAVTDEDCDGVRFYVEQADGSTQTVNAASCVVETVSASGKTYATKKWTAYTAFSGAGSYTVRAVSSRNGVWSTQSYETSAYVVASQDYRATSSEERRASDSIIQMIANWEGYASSVYADSLTSSGVPTIGYGYTFGAGATFYNHISQTEAWSLLVNRINTGSYTTEVNKFIKNNNLLMNQNQADCLISFGYNVGAGYWNSTAVMDVRTIMLNAVVPPEIPSGGLGAQITKKAGLYQTASRDSSQLTELASGTAVTVLECEFSNIQDGWYRVRTSSGQEGWVNSGYARFDNQAGLVHDLNYTNAYAFGSDLIRWNMAGGKPYAGLFYRRLGEANVYNYNDYTGARYNKYGYKYPSAFQGYA